VSLKLLILVANDIGGEFELLSLVLSTFVGFYEAQVRVDLVYLIVDYSLSFMEPDICSKFYGIISTSYGNFLEIIFKSDYLKGRKWRLNWHCYRFTVSLITKDYAMTAKHYAVLYISFVVQCNIVYSK